MPALVSRLRLCQYFAASVLEDVNQHLKDGSMKKILIAAVLSAVSANALAGDIYAGGGISSNSVSGLSNDETGFQFFVGFDLKGVNLGKARMAVEAGYMDSGDFGGGRSVDGLWGTGVMFVPVANNVDLIGRLGFDIGDDDGVMFGVGMGFAFNKTMQLRGEYVIRDNIDSLQANIAVRF